MKRINSILKMFVTMALLFVAVDAFSQSTKTISGKITDASGVPVIGASVIEAGTTNGVISDLDGNYKVTVKENASIEVSCIGYTTQKLPVSGRNVINVQLEEDSIALSETVVTALGIKRSEVAEYEVTNSMPLPFALVYSAQKRMALGID